MDFENLTEEQKAKARECKTAEELIELAKEEGVKLTEDQLEAVSGGFLFWGDSEETDTCPNDIVPKYDPSEGF